MDRWVTRAGLALCGLVVGVSVLLGAVRLAEGPRVLVHVAHPCPPPKADQTCITDHYEGSWVVRPWLIVAITLTVCAGAVGLTLVDHLRAQRTPAAT